MRSRTWLLTLILFALLVAPAVAAESERTTNYAEVNECRPGPSWVCVELWLYIDSAVPASGVHLSYFVHDLNYATIYVPQTNLYTIPLSMLTLDNGGQAATLMIPAGTVVLDFDGEPYTVPSDIRITWEVQTRDRVELDVIEKTFTGSQVKRFKRSTTTRPAVATGTLLGFPVDSRNGWPNCCRSPGELTESIETEMTRTPTLPENGDVGATPSTGDAGARR